MKYSKKIWWIIIPVLAGLLAACASPQPATPAASTQIPAAAPTAVASTTTAAGAGNGASSASGIKYVLVPAKSEASFTVREQLAKFTVPNDAVGTTNVISGSVTILPDGSIDSANSKFTVDLSAFKTDQSMRDNFVKRNVLHTDQYPTAVFVPKQVTGLPVTLPQNGDVSFKLIGDMTIQNVTKPIAWDVTGTVNNGEATGKATTSITFEDFNLTQPHVSIVLSIVDKINLAVTVDLQRASN